MVQTVLITGASRGIGLGLARLFCNNGYNVIATCRNPAAASDLSSLLSSCNQSPIVALDVASDDSVEGLKNYLEANGISVDHLINNAGVVAKNHPNDNLQGLDREDMLNVYNINVAGVAKVTEASGVLRKTNKNGKVINISSIFGSVAATQSEGCVNTPIAPLYRCSKAAQNMLTACQALQYPHVTFLMVHPGWVQTDMGGAGGITADIGVDESVSGIFDVFSKMETSMSGKFVNWKGEQIPY